jgi:hypothetical protein
MLEVDRDDPGVDSTYGRQRGPTVRIEPSTYLTLHRQLRMFSSEPHRIDFSLQRLFVHVGFADD